MGVESEQCALSSSKSLTASAPMLLDGWWIPLIAFRDCFSLPKVVKGTQCTFVRDSSTTFDVI